MRAMAVVAILGLTGSWSRAAEKPRYQRSVAAYRVPDVTLVNQDGARVRLTELVNSGKPVMLEFIFGTCTTICPVLAAGFADLQKRLEPQARAVQLVSISIDPEHDQPEVLRKFLEEVGAQPGWDFLTGSREDVDQVARAFDAYVSDKMTHTSLIFLRAPGESRWVRILGLVSGAELLKEYRKLLKD